MTGRIFAFSGKGGSGKTTLASLVLLELVRLKHRPVLAVDADPNATLAMALGVRVDGTVADLRDRMGEAADKVSEIPKDRLMGQWLAEILVEGAGFDLLTMGRPEGPKCYCYVNGLLRRYLKELRPNYAAIVVDCEAGMEYLSRLTVDDVDALVLVAEATRVGLTSAGRIAKLADSLPVSVRKRLLAVNKFGGPDSREGSMDITGAPDVDASVRIPYDDDLYRRSVMGEPVDAAAGPRARSAIEELTRLCLSPLSNEARPTGPKE